MTSRELIMELYTLKRRLEFLKEREKDKSKVYRKIYTAENVRIFYEFLEHEYENILERKYWDKIDVLIEKLKNPDLTELGAFPY